MKKIINQFIALLLLTNAANAQWSIDSLTTLGMSLVSTQNGGKALFANSNKFEIYDFTNSVWTSQPMSFARSNMKAATATGKSYFGGGGYIGVNLQVVYNNVDIFNSTTNTWSTTTLSQPRMVGAVAAIGNKILFAGGRQVLSYSTRVDIFNVNTGVRTTSTLSQGRHNMAVAVVGSKVIFAGGETGSIINGNYTSSNKVDIYDNTTGLWTTATLSSKKEQISVAIVGTKALFAGGLNNSGTGGQYVSTIDIYDAATNTWSVQNMSEGKYAIAAATASNKVYLAGGTTANSGTLTNRVEIYNATTNTMSYTTLSSPRMSMTVAKTPKRIMFAGGTVTWGNTGTNRVEVFDIATKAWSVEYLSQPRFGIATASYGGKALFAGGAEVWSSYPQYSIISKRVDIWTDPIPAMRLSTPETDQPTNIFPNPVTGSVTIQLQHSDQPTTITIYNTEGQLTFSTETENDSNEFDLNFLKAGIYLVHIQQQGKAEETLRIIKE